MDVLIWLEVDKQTCHERRQRTTRVPERVFHNNLWPCHVEYKEQVNSSNVSMNTRMHVLNGIEPSNVVLATAISAIQTEREGQVVDSLDAI